MSKSPGENCLSKYVRPWQTRDGRSLVLRPIRPEDEPLEAELIANLSPESSRYRFFYTVRQATQEMLDRFCKIDYNREMAIIAEYKTDGKRRNVGVGRLIVEPGEKNAEFAVVVADDFQSSGLGQKLVEVLIGIARERCLKSIYGIVLNDNSRMISLARKLGFTVKMLSGDESKIALELC